VQCGPSSNLHERGRGQRLKDRALVPNIGAKAGIESGGLTTVKAPFSDRIFRQMTGSGGRWRVSMGIFRKGAGTLGWAGNVTTQRRNLAVDQLQKQRQGYYRYKLKL
jgi:hypothetical protein